MTGGSSDGSGQRHFSRIGRFLCGVGAAMAGVAPSITAGRLQKRLLLVFMGIVGLLVVAPALSLAAARSPDFNVCAWGVNPAKPCIDGAWVEGNPMGDAAYREGDFVPFRVIFRPGVPGGHEIHRGQSYTLRIGYDIARSSLVAYDYLGTYNASEPARGQPIVPCSGAGVSTPAAHSCSGPPSTTDVPRDTHTFFANGNNPPFGAAKYQFSAWGVVLDGATQVPCANQGGNFPTIDGRPPATIPSGPQPRCIDLRFTVPGPGTGPVGAVIAWSGHIATEADWGTGKTYAQSGGGGAQFHMRLQSSTSFNLGNEEISLHAIKIGRAGFTTSVSPGSVHPGGTVIDTARLTGTPTPEGTVSFFVCGVASAPPDCSTGGVQVGQGVPVTTAGTADMSFTAGDAAGFYCFRAEYHPAALSPFQAATHTNRTDECFEVKLTQLAVEKVCVPRADHGHFTVHIHGPASFHRTVSCGGGTGEIQVPPGTYTVTETPSNNNQHTYPTVTFGGDCAGPPAGQVTLTLGESKTCVITNARVPTARLTVDKVCDPVTDGLFNVLISKAAANGPLRFDDLRCGESTGTVTLEPGEHTVSEEGGTGTSLGDYTTEITGDCAPDGSITLAAGDDKTCTIINRLKPSTLTVKKICVPETDSGQFEIRIDGSAPATGTVHCGGSTGPIPVTPGSHTVSELGAGGTDLAGYEQTIGGDCNSDGQVNVGPGEDATCEISNVRRSVEHEVGEVTLLKMCVPETDGGLFNLRIDGVIEHDQPCGGKVGPVALLPGTYHVGETAGAATDLSHYRTVIGGACAANGSIHLTAGQSKTCTITNIRHGERTAVLTVRKLCRPVHASGRFVLAVNEQTFSGIRCGQSTGAMTLAPGSHLVSELAVPSNIADRYQIVIGGDCAANGRITLRASQHATCTVTNIRRRSVSQAQRPRPPHRPTPPHPPPPAVTG